MITINDRLKSRVSFDVLSDVRGNGQERFLPNTCAGLIRGARNTIGNQNR